MSNREQQLALAALLSLNVKGNISNTDLEAAVAEGEKQLRARADELKVPHEGVEIEALVKAVNDAERPAQDPPPTTDNDKAAKSGKKTKARVLTAFAAHEADDVVELTKEELEVNVAAGRVDPHPKAVAYAESLKKK